MHRRSGESFCEKALFGVQLIWPLPAVVADSDNAPGFAGIYH